MQEIQQVTLSQGWEGGLAPALWICNLASWQESGLIKIFQALHFITGNFLNRLPIFKQTPCCQSFIDNLATLLNDWPCKLIAYVLMPDHFHLIVNPRDGRIKEFTGSLKSLSGRAISRCARGVSFQHDSEGSALVWQESFKATPLWSAWMIWQKINYIHANPVRAKLVESARDYRWSSFQAFYTQEGVPLKVDREWWWPDDSEKLSKAMKELGWLTYHKRK